MDTCVYTYNTHLIRLTPQDFVVRKGCSAKGILESVESLGICSWLGRPWRLRDSRTPRDLPSEGDGGMDGYGIEFVLLSIDGWRDGV